MKIQSLVCCSLLILPLAVRGEPDEVAAAVTRAEAFTSEKLIPLVLNGTPQVQWLGTGDTFRLRKQTPNGEETLIVDAATGRHTRLEATEQRATPAVASNPRELASPDGTRTAFIRDYNVWLRDSASGKEHQLTNDGAEEYAHGEASIVDLSRVPRRRAGIPKSLTGLLWSPSSRYIVSLRADVRKVPLRTVVTEYAPPDARSWISHPDRYSIAADNIEIPRSLTVIDTRSGEAVRSDADSSVLQDYAPMYFSAGVVWWDEPASQLRFITGTRDASRYGLASLDLRTARVRQVIEESEQYYYSLNPYDYARPNVAVLNGKQEALWYSQRSGFGHLYLYDLKTGKVKRAVTHGDWVVFDLIRVDERERCAYFTAGGREPGRNPYHRHLYRVNLDGGEPQLLTPEDADHQFSGYYGLFEQMLGPSASSFSPNGKYFVDVFSTIEQPPVMVIRSASGKLVSRVLEADATRLYASGWRPPERFVVKAADGASDLYGVLYRPQSFDAQRRYAIVDHVYPGPQGSWAPQTFMDGIIAMGSNAAALANLGIVTVSLDGRGTARRSKAFRYSFARNEDVFGAIDHKTAIETLARDRPWIDTTRVGITGGSFGGYGSTRAMLLFPEFFDVAVSFVGPPDFRSLGLSFTNERFFGVPGRSQADDAFYESISNTRLIDRLRGSLLLVYGGIDENVPLNHAFLMFDALIAANKPFDSLIVPNSTHAIGGPYVTHRTLEYFARHLGPPRAASH